MIWPFKHKHKWEAVESFRYAGECLYTRIIVYKCASCGKHSFSDRFAFMLRSGSLDCYFPITDKYKESGSFDIRLNSNDYMGEAMAMLSKYFEILNNKIYGIRLT